MTGDLQNHPLYEEVAAERARVRELEARFSMTIENGSIDLNVVRGYAAAVQSYTQAVMSWLSWVETETLQAAKTGKTAGG
jgi:hypothetical protein